MSEDRETLTDENIHSLDSSQQKLHIEQDDGNPIRTVPPDNIHDIYKQEYIKGIIYSYI